MVTKAYLLRRNIHPDVWKLLHSKRHRHHVLKSLHEGLLGHDPSGGCGSELCETEGERFIRSALTFEYFCTVTTERKQWNFYYQSPTIVPWTLDGLPVDTGSVIGWQWTALARPLPVWQAEVQGLENATPSTPAWKKNFSKCDLLCKQCQ